MHSMYDIYTITRSYEIYHVSIYNNCTNLHDRTESSLALPHVPEMILVPSNISSPTHLIYVYNPHLQINKSYTKGVEPNLQHFFRLRLGWRKTEARRAIFQHFRVLRIFSVPVTCFHLILVHLQTNFASS